MSSRKGAMDAKKRESDQSFLLFASFAPLRELFPQMTRKKKGAHRRINSREYAPSRLGWRLSRLQELLDVFHHGLGLRHERQMATVRQTRKADIRNIVAERRQALGGNEHVAIARKDQRRRFDMAQLLLDIELLDELKTMRMTL